MSFPPALPLRLVIFDCDGVLVDSEGPSNRVVAEEVSKLGWAMTDAESMHLFVGYTLEQIAPVVAEKTGRAVPDCWVEALRQRIIEVLSREVALVPGVCEAIAAAEEMGLACRVASNSSHREMRAKFLRTGLMHLLERAHSADDVAAGKPAPDVFLHAAAAAGIAPGACLVIEDSVPGALGAASAGMACLGFDPHGDGARLRAAGARVFRDMAELPALFRAAMRRAA